ncbi:MAG TPA: pyridoxal-dependent decarboxylase [Chryseolinea sp.]|nr:pyridoxal-dependent decarboxylase [Chryseolinea sp.]
MNNTDKQILLSAAIKALDYLTDISERRANPTEVSIQGLQAFNEDLPDYGRDALQSIDFLHHHGSPATMASPGGRYFGFVIGGSHTAALAANWLTSAWDQNAGLFVTSPVSAFIESVCERWLTEILPVARGASVGFVTGVTMANFTALAAARSAILNTNDWDVERRGLFGAPPIRVVISEEAHSSISKALALLGLGMDRVIRVPTDSNGCMKLDSLPELDSNTIVCIQAGNVNTGGMDSGEIVREAKRQGAWVHVDGAFGLWAGACERKKDLTEGYDLADSWATDGHKWLNVPYDNGIIICRDKEHLRKAMSMDGSYLDQTGARIPYQYTPELSRRARATDIWAAMRTLGRNGIDDLISRSCLYAELFAHRLEEAGFEILNEVETNQVLVSFGTDTETSNVIKAIQEDGTCWVGGTTWKGRMAMRISVSSWATQPEDVTKSVNAMISCAKKVVLKAM